jgi:hypothetical protein
MKRAVHPLTRLMQLLNHAKESINSLWIRVACKELLQQFPRRQLSHSNLQVKHIVRNLFKLLNGVLEGRSVGVPHLGFVSFPFSFIHYHRARACRVQPDNIYC